MTLVLSRKAVAAVVVVVVEREAWCDTVTG